MEQQEQREKVAAQARDEGRPEVAGGACAYVWIPGALHDLLANLCRLDSKTTSSLWLPRI